MLCFEIRLIKAGEDYVAVVWFEFSVHVLSLVSFVFEVLESLAIGDIVALKFDYYLVFAHLLQILRKENSVANIHILGIFTQICLIYCNTFHIFAFVVNEATFRVVAIFLVIRG